MLIRFANERDAEAIAAIYAPYVANTTVSFELEPPDAAEMRRRIVETSEKFAFLVCCEGGEVAGYAYAHDFRERKAYRFDTEFSVYIKEEYHGKGVGAALYGALFDFARLQGYCRVYSSIAMPNEKSVKFHHKMGFTEAALFKKTGFKQEHWIDLLWLEKELADFSTNKQPREPQKIGELKSKVRQKILDKYSEER